MNINFQEVRDKVICSLRKHGEFSEIYLCYSPITIFGLLTKNWHMKIPVNIEISMWYLKKELSSPRTILIDETGME